MDPYKTLGVGKDADPDTIKRSYRALAKVNHPDAGGSPQTMAEIAKAAEILTDPYRRKHYDETGELEQRTTRTAILARFSDIAMKLLLEREGINIKESVAHYKKGMDSEREKKTQAFANRRRLIDKARARLLKAPENDMVTGLLDGQIASLEREEKMIFERFEIESAAIALFDDYQFEEPPENNRWGSGLTSGSTTSRW